MKKTLKTYNDFLLEAKTLNETLLTEEDEILLEKLVTFANKAYPPFGNVVIIAGGAGSGKGFVKDKLLGIEGWTYDVDVLKAMTARAPKIQQKVKDETGFDLKTYDEGNPEHVSTIHNIVANVLNLDNKKQAALFASVFTASPDRKPNLIFDVTLKDLRKLQNLTEMASNLGYNKKNIHIVWVLNEMETAIKQNAARTRKVPIDILKNTHLGASQTMATIFHMESGLKKYMDGDIWVVPNKVKVDSTAEFSKLPGKVDSKTGKETKAFYLKDAVYFKVKESGKPMNMENVSKDLIRKIAAYTPKAYEWEKDL